MKNKSQAGSALVQMVVGIAFLGILTATIGTIIKNSQDEQMFVVYKSAREKLSESIKNILYANPACACTFQGVNIDPATIATYVSGPDEIRELSLYSANCARNMFTLARVGERRNGLKVNKIRLQNLTLTNSTYSGDLLIESQRPNTNTIGVDIIPFQFTAVQVGAFLKVNTCRAADLRPSTLIPLNAGAVYLKYNPNGPRESYQFEELAGTGVQTILAKLDLRWGRNFTVQIYTPGVAAPQTVEISTGVDGHIRHDSSIIKMTVVDGNFSAIMNCRTGGCMNLWSASPDARNRITPKAILQQPE